MNLEVEYAARLREFMRPTGYLRRCRETCAFPDRKHEANCPDRIPRDPRPVLGAPENT